MTEETTAGLDVTDPEVQLEQHHLDRSHGALAAMRSRTARLLADLRTAGKPDQDYEAALVRRVNALGESRRPLLFGRIDEKDGARWRIGRRHVEEPDGEVLVVDWRAPVAEPFYRARPGDALGLEGRRQIMVEASRVVAVADDLFEVRDGRAGTTRLRGGDVLLRELERARTGEMLDIVATIQEEQDAIIRGPLTGLVVVQGGPGTGKTAVGLHRAAYLLYNHPELERTGVLVLGPSRAFIRYIAQVLPSLGESSVVQTTISDIAPRVRVRAEDDPATAAIKGDARMAQVVFRALGLLRGRLTHEVTLTARHVRIRLGPETVNAIVDAIAHGPAPYKAGRAALRARLLALCRQVLRARGRIEATEDWLAPELGRSRGFTDLLDGLWPTVSPNQLVHRVLTDKAFLRAAAEDLLCAEEVDLLVRPPVASAARGKWAKGDLALLDEANHLINGRTRTYGHIVCDEAQDLSAMQLRMLTRRTSNGSMTVLGDIAQATGALPYGSWEELMPHLPHASEVRREELTLGYRAPAQILDFASRLLPASAPSVRPTSSVREGRFSPDVRKVAAEHVEAESMTAALQLADEGYLVGLIVRDGTLSSAFENAARHDANVGHVERDGISRRVTLVPAPAAKGLEFDAVVVAEPAEIAARDLRGLRLLYVALTRPIHKLVIVHSLPLPAPLAV